ncbi:MAG: DUF1178 family protein [Hyphomonas sp.]
MIRYALSCGTCEHEFEAWFASSDAYDQQSRRKLVLCPECDGREVAKQIMAPSVKTTKGKTPAPDPEKAFAEFAAKAREHVAENFDYVGDAFAEEARAMYYGEQDDRPIWGETTADEREALKEEGVQAMPLPAPFAPKKPKRKSGKALN